MIHQKARVLNTLLKKKGGSLRENGLGQAFGGRGRGRINPHPARPVDRRAIDTGHHHSGKDVVTPR